MISFFIPEWRPVIGFEGVYEVSSYGEVRRLKAAKGASPGATLKPSFTDGGRLKLTLSNGGKVKNVKVHIVVARAFLGVPIGKFEVNHKDGDPTNNRLDNLEYSTPKENSLHARRVLFKGIGENHCNAKLTEESVKVIRVSNESQYELAKRYGVSQTTINDVLWGRTWRTTA